MTKAVTGGVVKYGRTVKTGDYENKRADVELSFTVPEGDDLDPVMVSVCDAARAKCEAMLGLRSAPLSANVSAPVNAETKIPEAKSEPKSEAKAELKAEPKAEVKAESKAEVKAPELSTMAELPQRRGRGRPPGRKVIEPTFPPLTEDVEGGLEDDPSGPVQTDEIDILDDLEAPAKREIPDTELMAAVQRKQAEINDAARIRAVLSSCGIATPPGKVRDLPQERRQEFLDKIAELKA